MSSNSTIIKKLKLAAKLLELHGENEFKIRSYTKAAENIATLEQDLSTLNAKEVEAIEGIGKSTAEKITSIVATGTFPVLSDLLADTPEGVIEMMKLPGFGAKKILQLWKDAGAESLEDVKRLCRAGEVAGLKGFGEKSQVALNKAVDFLLKHRGYFRYATVEPIFKNLADSLAKKVGAGLVSETGELRRRMEVINVIELLVGTNDFEATRDYINTLSDFEEEPLSSGPFTWSGRHVDTKARVSVIFCAEADFFNKLIATTGSPAHLNGSLSNGDNLGAILRKERFSSEKEAYDAIKLPFIAPELREGTFELASAEGGTLPELVEMTDLKGILHNHSTYSDGKNTLQEMAEHCKNLGYEYLGITDHSQTAVYANGLQEFKVKEQQEEIRQLNEKMAPFKIFSGIESDILADGSLDYSDEILASFDFIVASVHSGQNMDITKATNRLLTAIANPYTTILGHMTGRLLLEREGYPVDHKTIIDACVEHNVVIEINASPYRLDIDWRWVHYAIEKGLTLSINPDAHKKQGYDDMYYGLLAGRKGGLTKERTLNCMSLHEITQWFSTKKAAVGN